DGEPVLDVGERVHDAIRRALARVPEGGLLVAVGHGAPLRAGINRMIGLPEEMRQALGPLGNCSWALLGPLDSGGSRLLAHNASSLPEDRILGADRWAGRFDAAAGFRYPSWGRRGGDDRPTGPDTGLWRSW